MAEDKETKNGNAPPKIRLKKNGKSATNGNGTSGNGDKKSTTHLDLTEASAKQAAESENKKSTTHLDLTSEQATSAAGEEPKKSTTHLDLSDDKPQPAPETEPKKSTTHLDLSESETVASGEEAKDSTTHIDLSQAAVKKPDSQPPAKQPAAPDAKSATTHIDLTEADEFLKSGAVPEGKLSRRKSETARIDLSDTSNLDAQTEAVPEGRQVEKPKADTSKVDLQDAEELPIDQQVETAKKQTMRVILSQTAGMGDIEIPESEDKPPKTVKLKREEQQDSPEQAETLVDQPVSSDDKGATSRLDLPEGFEKPATQKKTIRIKRPDSAPSGTPGAKPARTLKLARSEGEGAVTQPESLREPVAAPAPEEHEPGAVFAAVALLAVLVTGVLVYLLMTQMPFGAEWPWPGKLVFHG